VKHDQITLSLLEREHLKKIFHPETSLFVAREILDELLLVPVCRKASEIAHIYRLNEMGNVIWKHLDGRSSLEDITHVIADEYDVDVAVVQRDIIELSQQLVHIGALREEDNGSAAYP